MNEQPRSAPIEGAIERRCLVAVFQPRLVLAKGLTWPQRAFVVKGKEYRDVGLGEWTGFYDWLRAADGSLLGVRYWLNSSTEFLATYANSLRYVIVDPSRSIEVYFSDHRAFEPKLSCDQAFLYDAVFRAADGEYAIAFGSEDLSTADLNALDQLGLHPAESIP